jgi:hypothetical protein
MSSTVFTMLSALVTDYRIVGQNAATGLTDGHYLMYPPDKCHPSHVNSGQVYESISKIYFNRLQ